MNPIGWNPCQKVYPRSKKRNSGYNDVLNRHKAYLKKIEDDRKANLKILEQTIDFEENRFKEFREKAQKQRKTIYNMKLNKEDLFAEHEKAMLAATEAQIQDEKEQYPEEAMSQKSKATSKKSRASKKSRPAWATTEQQQEEDKEAEIDQLLEFAYELDYDKYMNDFEIRQVFSIIQDRVNEIKQDQDWKKNIAEEWNKAGGIQDEQPAAVEEAGQSVAEEKQHSVYSYSKLLFLNVFTNSCRVESQQPNELEIQSQAGNGESGET